MVWSRVCPFCGESQETEYGRILVVKKVAVLNFKNNRYWLEYKNNTNEEICCERCAKTHTIKELWEKIQNAEPNIEEHTDE